MQIVLIVIICIILWPAIVSGAKFILVTITAALIYVASTQVTEPSNIFGIQSGMRSAEVAHLMASWSMLHWPQQPVTKRNTYAHYRNGNYGYSYACHSY